MANNKKTPKLNAPQTQSPKNGGAKQKAHEESPKNGKKNQQKRVDSGKAKKERVEVFEESARSKKLIHQIMPYLLMVAALFVVLCFLLIDLFEVVSYENSVGVVGKGIRDVLCGLFGFSAFLVPIFLAVLGLTWSAAVQKNCLLAKHFYALVSLASVAALIHCIYASATEPLGLGAGLAAFYGKGVALEGGGVIGGYLGELLYKGIGIWGSILVTVILSVVFFIFLLGLTPKYVFTLIRYRIKIFRERVAAAKAEKLANEERVREEKKRERDEELKIKRAEEARRKEEEAIARAEEEARRKEEEERKKDEEARARELADPVIIDEGVVGEESSEPILVLPPATVEEPKKKGGKGENPEDMGQMLKEVFGGEGRKSVGAVGSSEEAPDEELDPDEALISAMKENVDLDDIGDIGDDGIEEIAVEPEPVEYVFPPIALLAEDTSVRTGDNSEELNRNAKNLMDTLRSFNIKIKEISYSRGPTITRYELKPEAGQRVRQIANLVDDIALNLATTGVRIEAPIPNKPAVGIEVPNANPTTVYLRSLIDTEKFESESSKLTACLGADVGGKSVYFNIAKMPHLLIAGATGMGKSVCINSIIVSLLYKARPDEVKLILIDPKKVEFNIYKDIPHLYCPIVSDPAKAAGALASAVAEMERRFALIEEVGVRDIFNYNAVTKDDPDREFMPQMVIIIDELADLMMTAADAVESSICRLAQKARAAGIHIIIGTQRPSVDVITGLIKANIPSRIACTVASQVDSRTIIDIAGAEKLIGKGDMLFAPVGSAKPMRVQGAFVSENEVEKIVSFIKANNTGAKYNEDFVRLIDEEAAKCTAGKKGGGSATPMSEGDVEGGLDPKFRDAVELAIDSGKVSTSLLQRRLEIGYGRAAKIIDQMEEMGYVSAPDGNKPRKILITKEDFMQLAVNDDI